MSNRAVRAASALAVVVLWHLARPVPVGAQTNVGDIVVAIDPPAASAVLGESIDLTVTVTNNGTSPTSGLVAHLDITDPGATTSVDPEDWTATLSRPVGDVAPGASRRLTWSVQPITGGTFTAYAVALAPGNDRGSISNLVSIDVAEQRSLNPGGILPVAVAMPTLVGALLVWRVRAPRRTRSQDSGTASP